MYKNLFPFVSASRFRNTMLTGLATILLASVPASAQTILQPHAASTNMGFRTAGPNPPSQVCDQSGLIVGYTSQVTDFDAYVASAPQHTFGNPNVWFSQGGLPTGNFDFDLGGNFTIQALALWNLTPATNVNLRGFTLLADDDAAFSTPTTLGTYEALQQPGPNTTPQVFGFAPTSAKYVRMVITSNYGHTGFTGLGEAAFKLAPAAEPSAVPEPGALWLFLPALGVVALLRRQAQTVSPAA